MAATGVVPQPERRWVASSSSIVVLGLRVGVGVQVMVVQLVVEVEWLVRAVKAFCIRRRWGKFWGAFEFCFHHTATIVDTWEYIFIRTE